MKREKFTFVDLFAGIGGFRMALENLGGKCVGFSEIAPDAIKAYCCNYGETVSSNLGDITKLQGLPRHDFLTGGVPCQSWSIAGRNLGFDDARGQLWNDALYLLKVSKPKAFIFENVKGLADPRNRDALNHILQQIRQAGYHADYFLLNAYDYGVPQNRIRIYIIGFAEEKYFTRFTLPEPHACNQTLSSILQPGGREDIHHSTNSGKQSISANEEGLNDYFLFNDLRNGYTTVHSWDLIETSEREKQICQLLLQNRRKSKYGILDGNPLALRHFQELDATVSEDELETLVQKGILRKEDYLFRISPNIEEIKEPWARILSELGRECVSCDELKMAKEFKIAKISVTALLKQLVEKGLAQCLEFRYDFKNTKISTGLNGVNRVFLPTSRIYPTLVASDTNDFITDVAISAATPGQYKEEFLQKVYRPGKYRRITCREACAIQGFPADFKLPASRARWMKLVGNSVAVPMIQQLAERVLATGVFDDSLYTSPGKAEARQLTLFPGEV